MTHSGKATKAIEEVRRRTIAVLDDLVQKADELGLAEPPPVLERCRRNLRENICKVLVVGGTKRGKSTFVNALIGRDVLPTGVATSQVFNIRPSDQEAYRLRYEDGSEREVLLEDIPRITAEAGATTTGPFVRWIEVDAPVRFLPEGLTLLDTPGRTRIKDHLMPDAVIFALESGQPMSDDDLEFIEEILDATHNIFFIQTKIDLYDEEDWRSVQHLNQEILEEKFGGRLAGTRVWPISSTNLRKVGKGSLMASQHGKLAVALRAFLAGVVGWNPVAEAMLMAVRYHAASREVFSGQLAAESQQKRSEMQNVAVEGKRRFEEDRGRKHLELRENLQRTVAVGKQSFANALQMGGDIELAQKAKIDDIKSLTEANRVGKEMPDEVAAAAMNCWTRVCREVQHRCVELLGPEGSSPNVAGSAISSSGLDVEFKTDYFLMLRGAASGIILLAAASVGVAATGVSLPPLGLVALPILLVLVVSGIQHARKNQLKSARQELRMHLAEVLQKVRRHFFDVDLMSGRFSRMDEYFGALERSMHEQARNIAEKKSNEAIKIDPRTREAHECLIEWDTIGKAAKDVMALITEQTGDTLIAGETPTPLPPDPAPREAAAHAEGKSDKAKADRRDVFAGRLDLSGEQAADRRYAELKRQHGMRLRWAVVPAILAALAWSGWFVFVG